MIRKKLNKSGVGGWDSEVFSPERQNQPINLYLTGIGCEALAKSSQLVPVLNRQSNRSWWENLLFILKLTPSTFRLKALHLALFFLAFAFSSKAQIYPVQVMPVLVPPYSLNTSDYYNGTTERLAIVLTNTDLQKPVLNVRLRMYIEGQNARLQSRDGVYYPTITLDAGIPQRISLSDLAPYFNIDTLNFSGITRAMYAQNGKLPEGFYSFCFEAIEINTGQVLSRKSCSMAYITLSDPPLLNLPLKGESIASKAVQNIIFQWTPRNLGSPNGAFNTEYEFTLKELWDTGIAPEAAFESTQPLYQVTVRPTTLLMGPAEPQLIPGKRYAWRVRVVSTSPTGEQADSYRNNGFSEIYWFTYQSDCKSPLAINSSVSSGRATINWTADPSNGGIPAGGYTLQYREKSLSGSKWYSVNTLENRAMLYDLKPGSTYEYRVGSSCVAGNIGIGIDQATYSDMLTLEINGNPKDTATINCGMISPEISITNRTPIQALNQGDLIMAGGFPVKLTKVTGGGSFSGEGYVIIPMLGQVNVKVRFSNIQVNTERQLFGGVIETTYDAKEIQVVDVKEVLDLTSKIQNDIINSLEILDSKNVTQNDISEKFDPLYSDLEKLVDLLPYTDEQKAVRLEEIKKAKLATQLASTGKNDESSKQAAVSSEILNKISNDLKQDVADIKKYPPGWYYWTSLGWKISPDLPLVYKESVMNDLGFFSSLQAVRLDRERLAKKKDITETMAYINKQEGANEIAAWSNPFYVIYQLSPVKSGLEAYESYDRGDYGWSAFNAAITLFGVGELRELGLLKEVGIMGLSVEQMWKLPNFGRGILFENYLAKTTYKGFKHLAEVSRFFPTIDFIKDGLAVSLKTVNAEQNFEFANIFKNIERLANVKAIGQITGGGELFLVKDVRLDIAIPKGYNRKVLDRVVLEANRNNIEIKFIEL